MSKVTKNELEAYVHTKREVRLLSKELAESDFEVADTTTGSSAEYPYVERTYMIRGIDERRIERLQRRLKRKETICERVEDYIDAIDDSEMYNLLKLRFLKGFCWMQVVRNTDFDLTPDGARKKVERFLNENL